MSPRGGGRRHFNRQLRADQQPDSSSNSSRQASSKSSHSHFASPVSSGAVPTINQLHPGTAVSIVLKQDQPTGRQVQGFVADLMTRGNHPRGIKVRLSDGRVGRAQRLASEEEANRGTNEGSQVGRNGEELGRSFGRLGLGNDSDMHGHGAGRVDGGPTVSRGQSRGGVQYQDYRQDGYDYDTKDTESSSLLDYVKVKPVKQRGRRGRGNPALERLSNVASSSGSALNGGEDDGRLIPDNEEPQDSAHCRRNLKSKARERLSHGQEELGPKSHPSSRTENVAADSWFATSATSTCPVCHAFEGDEDAVAHHVAAHFD